MLSSLRSIAKEVSNSTDLGAALDSTVNSVTGAINADSCSIFLLDQERGDYAFMATQGLYKRSLRRVRIKPDEGLVGLVTQRDEPINLERADQHPRFRYYPETGEERYKAFLGAPIISGGEALGVIIVQRRKAAKFDDEEEAFLSTLASQLAVVLAHARSTGDLRRLVQKRSGRGRPRAVRNVPFYGISGARGIAIGRAFVLYSGADLHSERLVRVKDWRAEAEKFAQALERTRAELQELEDNIKAHISAEEAKLFQVYGQMLSSDLQRETLALIESRSLSARSAWSEVILKHCRAFDAMEDPYLRERSADIRDLGRRLLRHLLDEGGGDDRYPKHTVLVGQEITASMLASVPRERLVAVVSVRGSVNSHLSILARSMGVPTVVGVQGLRPGKLQGKEVAVDGYSGTLYVDPDDEHRQRLNQAIDEDTRLTDWAMQMLDAPCVTRDGHRMTLMMNTGLLTAERFGLAPGADGVGLYRSEIEFLGRDRLPSEEEQCQSYKEHLHTVHPGPVNMRTLDIGGDKPLPYFPIEQEDNPCLGWRGIRISLDQPELFLVQVRAMLRASAGLSNLRILLPMISGMEELDAALGLIYRAYNELTREEGLDLEMPPIGAMIEVPSAVFMASAIARKVDFVSVGSNDLIQYLMAVDRNNPRVAGLYQALHPAVLQALNAIAQAVLCAGRPLGICGEMASDPTCALLLMAMGYDSLSMSSSGLLRVQALIRLADRQSAERLLQRLLVLPDVESVREAISRNVRARRMRQLMGLPQLGRKSAAGG